MIDFLYEVKLEAPSMFSKVLNLKSSHAVASCYSVLCNQSPFPYGIAIDLSSPEEAKYFLLEGVPLGFQCGEGHAEGLKVRSLKEGREIGSRIET
jgi:hypothetical protein